MSKAHQIVNRIRKRQLQAAAKGIKKVKAWRCQSKHSNSKRPPDTHNTGETPETPNRGHSVRNSVFIDLPQPEPKTFAERKRPKPSINEAADRKAGKDHHRKACFASMAELKRKYREVNVDTLWEQFKIDYNVSSRSQFSEREWALCAARIRCLIENPQLIENKKVFSDINQR